LYYRLTHDRVFLHAETPALGALVDRIASRQRGSGPARGRLLPEPLSTDLETHDVDSVPGQIEAITGLRAIAHVWSVTGSASLAKRASTLAAGIDRALRPAVAKASTRLRDGSLFVPDQLSYRQRPYQRLTATKDGSYWNLVMPYAFGSGWFTTEAGHGILRYLLAHGGRLLGLPRTYARTVYGDVRGVGVAPVYELGDSRLLADADQPDQLVLTLYGLRAAGMTDGTYISGEAVSVLPLRSAYERSMFMPPNTGANASFLGTLRELLVHERRNGLDLAFSTPRAWLTDGDTIGVQHAPTSFGPLSYSIARTGMALAVDLHVPRTPSPLRIRFRLPSGVRVGVVHLGRRRLPFDAKTSTLTLRGARGHLTLAVSLR
jgi:hypothetical protein